MLDAEEEKHDHFLWLRPGISVLSHGDDLILIGQDGEVIQIEGSGTLALQLTERLNGEESRSTLSLNPYLEILLALLKERGWLVTLRDPLSALLGDFSALSREISAFAQLYPDELDWHFRQISKRKVLIIGIGGIGSNVAFALCANGVGAITIVDLDRVEQTNLNRQFLFSNQDVGLPKVDVVARELTGRFPGTVVNAVHGNFDEPNLAVRLLHGTDLVVVCGESGILQDNPELCDGIPIILSGYRGMVGVVGPLLVPTLGSACWSCVMSHYDRSAVRRVERSALPRQSSWNPSGFAINSMTGSICSTICVGFLSAQPAAAQWLGVQLRASSANLAIERVCVQPVTCEHSTVRYDR
jgi:hypothetical protein